ncbi:unnamed protein product [Mucor hiemalis]
MNVKNTQVTKVDGKEKVGIQNVFHDKMNDENDQDVLGRVALSGSILYGLNPENQMFERYATKTYAITILIMPRRERMLNDQHSKVLDSNRLIDVEKFLDDNEVNDDVFNKDLIGDFKTTNTESIENVSIEGGNLLKGTGYVANNEDKYTANYYDILDENEYFHSYEDIYVTCKQLETSTKVTSDMVIPIIRKGTLLESLKLVGEEISTSFSIYNCPKDSGVFICKCTIF